MCPETRPQMPLHRYQHFLAQSQPLREAGLQFDIHACSYVGPCLGPVCRGGCLEMMASRPPTNEQLERKKGYYCVISMKGYVQSFLKMHIYRRASSVEQINAHSRVLATMCQSRHIHVNVLVNASWNPACQIVTAPRAPPVAVPLVLVYQPGRPRACLPPEAWKMKVFPRSHHISPPETRPLRSARMLATGADQAFGE